MNSDDYVHADVVFKVSTRDAILVAADDDELWIPRSVLDYSTDKAVAQFSRGQAVIINLRMWFADKKGMNYDY